MIDSDRESEGNLRAARFHGPDNARVFQFQKNPFSKPSRLMVLEIKRKLERTFCSNTRQGILL